MAWPLGIPFLSMYFRHLNLDIMGAIPALNDENYEHIIQQNKG